MDPTVGRFASVDPFKGFEDKPVSLHRYLYADASPINFSVPTGRYSLSQVMTTVAVAGVLTQIAQVHFYRLANPGQKEITWKGTMVSGSHGVGGGVVSAEEGFVFIDAYSEAVNGKKTNAQYLGFFVGLSVERSFPKAGSLSLGTFEVTTPGGLGAKPWALAGAILTLRKLEMEMEWAQLGNMIYDLSTLRAEELRTAAAFEEIANKLE